MVTVICGESRILFPWNEAGSTEESNWNGQKKYETDRRRVKTRARFCNHTFGVCTTKELSHCYVKPNVTFMRAPSSRSRPVEMVHKRPTWLAARPLSETHLKQTGTLGKVQCRGWWMCGTTFIGMNGKDHVLPEELGLYPNLGKEKKTKQKRKKIWGGSGLRRLGEGMGGGVYVGGTMEKDVVAWGPAVLGGRRGAGFSQREDGWGREGAVTCSGRKHAFC